MQRHISENDLSRLSQSLLENMDDASHCPSIAVLPFTDRDEESRQKHSGRWLADDVTHHLSRFRYLSVVGRRASHAVMRKHALLKAVGQTLGTRYLATGAVQWTSDHLTTMICLIDSASGKQLWCSPYHRNRGCLTDLEDDLAKEITTGLAVSIEAMERARLDRLNDGDKTLESAATLTLMADHLTKQFQWPANERARQLAEAALLIDPMSARAHAVLSRTHHLDSRYAWSTDPDKSNEHAIELAELAIQLDPMEASGYAELGMVRHFQRDYDPALAAYRRALDINPNDPDILADFSDLLISDGSPEQAIEPLVMAIHLRPDRAGMYRYYLAGAFDALKDDETVVSLLSMKGGNQERHRILATSYARLGIYDKAAFHADMALKAHPDFSLAHWRTVLPHRDQDTRERIIEGMERAGLR